MNPDQYRWLTRAWARRYGVLHHLLLAASIASATVFLEQTKMFAPFDLGTRAAMSYWQAWKDERARLDTMSQGFRVEWNPRAAEDRPLVIIVPQLPMQAGMHPTAFATLLMRVAAQQEPAVLAVGLQDLDPYLDEPRLNDPICDYLAAPNPGMSSISATAGPCVSPGMSAAASVQSVRMAIQGRANLRQALAEIARTTPVVVETSPLPLDVPAFDSIVDSRDPIAQRVLARRLSWAFDLCQIPGLYVALRVPPPLDSNGTVFEGDVPTLGNVAWQVARSPRRQGDLQLINTSTSTDTCAPLRDSFSARKIGALWNPRDLQRETREVIQKIAILIEPPRLGSIGTITSRYYKTLSHGMYADMRTLAPGRPISDIIPRGLRNRVVFLGDDGVLTQLLRFKAVPEIDFHGAVYYSNLHGAIGPKHAFAFLFDVMLGSLLGLLFAWSWSAYGRARTAMDQVSASSLWGVIAKVPSYLWARGVLGLNLVLIVVLTWVMFYAANFLLSHDVWINPLPLVVGMSLKGLLASRQLADEHKIQDWWTFYNKHPDVPLQLLSIIICLGLVLYIGR